MTWAAALYLALGYYHFRKTLQALEPYDTWDTVLLNSVLALAIGPLLLLPVLAIAAFSALDDAISRPILARHNRIVAEWINMVFGAAA